MATKAAKKSVAKPAKKTAAKKSAPKKATPADGKAEAFLYRYLNNSSPVGHEDTGQQIWLDYLKPYIDDVIVDTYGTAVGVINPGKKYKVVIEAHSDEISWMVSYITDSGYLYVKRNGGADHMIAPSMRVNVTTEKGKTVPGVFGWPAIHVRDPAKEEAPTKKNLCVDVGAASKDEVLKMGINIGSIVNYVDGLTELNKKFLLGRALDNRLGGYVIAQVARRLKDKKAKLPFTLYLVNSVQEEVGCRGAEMISRRLAPDIAVCIDVTHDTYSPMYNKKDQGDIQCGKGPVIPVGPAIQRNVAKQLMDVATKNKIAFQRDALSPYTGTDTDHFAYSATGVASALLSIPLKYMHTTVEMVHKDDVEASIQLYVDFLLSLKGSEDWRYFKK